MSPAELNKKLVEKAEQALRYLFKDAGKFGTGRFTIGNAMGEEGDSLFVYLKDGRFKDSSAGQRGDLLELFAINRGSKEAGIQAAYDFLGMTRPAQLNVKIKKPWKKPVKDWTQLTENPSVLEYLTAERKISIGELKKAQVSARDNKYYVFKTFTHDVEPVQCGAQYCNIKRKIIKGKPKKEIFQSDKPLATLFGHTTCDKTFKNANGKTYVIITEGQIDCLSFRTQGLLNVVSVPFGTDAQDWIENSWEFIRSFDEVYLCFDNDEAGEREVDKAAKRIGYERCRKLTVPAHFKDPNDAHLNGYDLHTIIDSAEEFKPSKLIEASVLHEESLIRMSKGRRELQGIPFLGWEDDASIEFRIRPKEMTIYTGYPGSGKSNALYQMVAYLVFALKQTVIIASLEEDAEDILGLIMIHALARQYEKPDKNVHVHNAFVALKKEMHSKIFFYHHRNRAPFEDVLETGEYTIRKHGAQHFIFDSVAKTDLNIEDNEDANEFVGRVVSSMNDTGAHYHIVAHARKGNDKSKWEMPGLQEIKGANAFGVETFNVVSVWRDPKKADMLAEFRTKGYYEKREWGQVDQKPQSGGFKKNSYAPSSITRLGIEEISKYPDGCIYVAKQKVGGITGKYDIYYNKENYRISRYYDEEPEPYAKEIYEKYIKGPEADEQEVNL